MVLFSLSPRHEKNIRRCCTLTKGSTAYRGIVGATMGEGRRWTHGEEVEGRDHETGSKKVEEKMMMALVEE